MNQQSITYLKSDEGEDLLSHYRISKSKYGDVSVPVVDCRDGIPYRIMAIGMIKQSNVSKWINYNQYHKSSKKK